MKLTFDGISSCWEEGIPLGNGRMGAVLCSEPETDVLYLNDDTLWSGYPHAETSPVTPEIVAKARQASLHDDYATATRIIKEATLQEKDEQIYEPFGTARIQYSTSADGRESMKRQLDLARALAGETFQMGDANVHVDAWCSEPDDLLVYRMSSDAPIDVNISVSGTFLKQSRASLETVSDGHRATLIVMGRMPGLNIGLLPHPSENPWEDEQDGTGMAYAGAFSLTVTGGDINVVTIISKIMDVSITPLSSPAFAMILGTRPQHICHGHKCGDTGQNLCPYRGPMLCQMELPVNPGIGSSSFGCTFSFL